MCEDIASLSFIIADFDMYTQSMVDTSVEKITLYKVVGLPLRLSRKIQEDLGPQIQQIIRSVGL